MDKIYYEGGIFNFVNNLPQIIYSTAISGSINTLIKNLAITESNFILFRNKSTKKDIHRKSKKLTKILKIKFVIFFILIFILLSLFWIYLACFSSVYKNTQIHLIIDTIISFIISMIYPFGIYILFGLLRMQSLKGKNKEYLYKLSNIIQYIF